MGHAIRPLNRTQKLAPSPNSCKICLDISVVIESLDGCRKLTPPVSTPAELDMAAAHHHVRIGMAKRTELTMDVLDWMPSTIVDFFDDLGKRELSPSTMSALGRLTTDARMRRVFEDLLRRRRRSGEFLYPARRPLKSDQMTPEHAQLHAIQEALRYTIVAAGGQIWSAHPDDIQATQSRLATNAGQLRTVADDLELAVCASEFGFDDPISRSRALADAAALRRVASWQEQLSKSQPPQPRLAPLKYSRGDPVVRGVKIAVGNKLRQLFGVRLDRTAAALTAVALGTKTKTTLRPLHHSGGNSWLKSKL
jgi:hypothetical protein